MGLSKMRSLKAMFVISISVVSAMPYVSTAYAEGDVAQALIYTAKSYAPTPGELHS
jgi:hypothetical protein